MPTTFENIGKRVEGIAPGALKAPIANFWQFCQDIRHSIQSLLKGLWPSYIKPMLRIGDRAKSTINEDVQKKEEEIQKTLKQNGLQTIIPGIFNNLWQQLKTAIK